MSWLARVILDRDDLAACRLVDNYGWHRAVWQCFPGRPEAHRDFLLRLDWLPEGCRLYVLSETQPVCPEWCPQARWEVREVAPGFLEHSRLKRRVKTRAREA